jgi:hypothetical protein|tara:strand:- start:3813 stop:4025 length:213 start_codon:yes stop_codon:yes gene_type:complete
MDSISIKPGSEDSGEQAEINAAIENGINKVLSGFFVSAEKVENDRMSEPLGFDERVSWILIEHLQIAIQI